MQFKLRFPVWIQSINSFYFDLLFQVVEVILAIPYSNAADENIFTMISKNKTSSCSSLYLIGTLSSITLVKTHIDNPLQWSRHKTYWKKRKNPQLNITDSILLSKYWGMKAVSHSVDFCALRCFYQSLKKGCCDSIETTARKTFMWNCDIKFFEIILPPHKCLLVEYLVYFWGLFLELICCDDDIYLLYCY